MGSVPDPPKDQTHQNLKSTEFIPPWQKFSDEQLRDMSTERGFSHVDPSPRPVPKELACPEDPPCTDLLTDPAGVLSDKERWPNHLCHVLFLRRSAAKWATSNLVALSTPELVQWQWEWPLPIGRIAVATRLTHYNQELVNLAPFEQQEEALWAIRVKNAGSTADLFGLGIRYGSGEQTTYEMGELKFVLRGSGTQLLALVRRAERWWGEFRDEGTMGRPAGTGTWESRTEFWIALRRAVHEMRAANRKVTQENVASHLKCSDRVLREWLKRYGFSWKEVLKIP